MGIYRESVLMIGVDVTEAYKAKYEEIVDDHVEKMQRWDVLDSWHDRLSEPDENGCHVVDQPMSGDLVVAGISLKDKATKGEYEYIEFNPVAYDVGHKVNAVQEYVKKEFGIDAAPKIISFVRFS